MGGCCSKPADQHGDNFVGPGRVVGAAPGPSAANKTSQAVPSSVTTNNNTKNPGHGHTLGSSTVESPREAAARAAEDRAKASTGGKLAEQLSKERNKTMNQHLNDASNANLAHRNMDEGAQARAWN